MQFGFMPRCSATDAIYILIMKKKIYFSFVDLEKAFDWEPRSILWWAMRKLGIDGWIVGLVKVMYNGANSRVRLNGWPSERFEVTVHQGSVLSQLLFAIVMEALCCEYHIGCPWELLYADDLVIMSDNFEDLEIQLQAWRTFLETWGLRIMWARLRYLVLQVRFKNQQEILNDPTLCVPKELV